MGQETNAALRRKLRTQRAAYEELLELASAIMAALCVRRGDGGTTTRRVPDAQHACSCGWRPRRAQASRRRRSMTPTDSGTRLQT